LRNEKDFQAKEEEELPAQLILAEHTD